ncbi:MAG: hypothetical protein NZT92_02920 [Abditibacteriales bacterium]|nr:hypothetical protein [Abditibacteriales bacterium]
MPRTVRCWCLRTKGRRQPDSLRSEPVAAAVSAVEVRNLALGLVQERLPHLPTPCDADVLSAFYAGGKPALPGFRIGTKSQPYQPS